MTQKRQTVQMLTLTGVGSGVRVSGLVRGLPENNIPISGFDFAQPTRRIEQRCTKRSRSVETRFTVCINSVRVLISTRP